MKPSQINEDLLDNPYQKELPKFLLIADGKYVDYYKNLSKDKQQIIESQANSRKLDTPESVNKFLSTRIFEVESNTQQRGFHIPKFKPQSELNEEYTSPVADAMKMLKIK